MPTVTNQATIFTEAFLRGADAFHNGHPKIMPRTGEATAYEYQMWHQGWFEAWRKNTLGEIKLGVYR